MKHCLRDFLERGRELGPLARVRVACVLGEVAAWDLDPKRVAVLDRDPG